jgi:hypothetical protein
MYNFAQAVLAGQRVRLAAWSEELVKGGVHRRRHTSGLIRQQAVRPEEQFGWGNDVPQPQPAHELVGFLGNTLKRVRDRTRLVEAPHLVSRKAHSVEVIALTCQIQPQDQIDRQFGTVAPAAKWADPVARARKILAERGPAVYVAEIAPLGRWLTRTLSFVRSTTRTKSSGFLKSPDPVPT